MNILSLMCNNSMILKVIYFIKLLMNVVFILVPIILIIMVVIDLVQLVLNPNQTIGDKPKSPEHDVRRLVIKRVMYAVVIFLIPTLVSLCNNILGEMGVDYVSCYNDADKDIIAEYEEIEELEEEMEQEYLNSYYEQLAEEEAETTRIKEESKLNVTSSSSNSMKEKFLDIALAEEGNEGGEKFWSWYGLEKRFAWCSIFVSWVTEEADLDDYIDYYGHYVYQGIRYFANKDQFVYSKYFGGDYTPVAGDIIFFQWKGVKITDPETTTDGSHVGIVISTDENYVYTIEGNNNDAVAKASYPLDSFQIAGYGVW